jgi:hypothetical protein
MRTELATQAVSHHSVALRSYHINVLHMRLACQMTGCL